MASTLEPGKCKQCGIPASMKCAGCMDAPVYEPGEPAVIVYCSSDCQKTHWLIHKAQCMVMRRRRELLRIATLLKMALITYRECAFDLDIERIEFHEGVLRLRGYQRSRPGHVAFPSHLTTNVEYKEAALTNNQCTLAMALLGPLARYLLAGIATSITSNDLAIGNPVFYTKLISGPGNPSNHATPPHTILIMEARDSKEIWVIDTAGAQYGFRDVLVPLKRYLEEKARGQVETSQSYDADETKDIDYFSTLPFMTATTYQRKKLSEERAARLHFAAFVRSLIRERGAAFRKDFFSGSAQECHAKIDTFLGELKLHMTEFVERGSKTDVGA